jgi:hypothetical protein
VRGTAGRNLQGHSPGRRAKTIPRAPLRAL